MRVLSVFGTRPEAIKMAPLVNTLAGMPGIESTVCTTGQHEQMLQQVMQLFDITADINLHLMEPNQSLNGLAAKIFMGLESVIENVKPDRILVHGDTTTAMAASMAAFHRGIPVGHVEAGLRTGNMRAPWPEEMNRRAVDMVSDLLFAPTVTSRENIESERLSGRIVVTGNTVIDALRLTTARIENDAALRSRLDDAFPMLDPGRRLLLVTGHRRENFGDGFNNICHALRQLAARPDIDIIYPVHLNPNVRVPAYQYLGNLPNVHLCNPLDYLHFVRLMQRAHVILTDSGGVQEEAPYLGKPVLVMRDVTERPEAVAAGTVALVGTETDSIVEAVHRLYDDVDAWARFARSVNPYGDGYACARIADTLAGTPVDEFQSGRRRMREVA